MRQSVSGTAAKISEVKMLIFNALKQSSRIITKANPPPTMNQNNSPSKPHVRPLESSELFVSVNRICSFN